MSWLLQSETHLMKGNDVDTFKDSPDDPVPSPESEERLRLHFPVDLMTRVKNEISGEELKKEIDVFLPNPAGLDWLSYFAQNPNRYPEKWRKGENDGNLYILYPRKAYREKQTGFEAWPYSAWDERKLQLEVGIVSLNNVFFSNHRVAYIL